MSKLFNFALNGDYGENEGRYYCQPELKDGGVEVVGESDAT
jgi:hypothetical protein